MRKSIVPICVALSTFAVSSYASIDCTGVPQKTKVGEYGTGVAPNDIIVTLDDKDYYLGLATDDDAKTRMSLTTTALVSGKRIRLRFWTETDCNTASINRTVPNSVQLLQY